MCLPISILFRQDRLIWCFRALLVHLVHTVAMTSSTKTTQSHRAGQLAQASAASRFLLLLLSYERLLVGLQSLSCSGWAVGFVCQGFLGRIMEMVGIFGIIQEFSLSWLPNRQSWMLLLWHFLQIWNIKHFFLNLQQSCAGLGMYGIEVSFCQCYVGAYFSGS